MIPPYLLQAAVLSEKERFNPWKPSTDRGPPPTGYRATFADWFAWGPWATLALILMMLTCVVIGLWH